MEQIHLVRARLWLELLAIALGVARIGGALTGHRKCTDVYRCSCPRLSLLAPSCADFVRSWGGTRNGSMLGFLAIVFEKSRGTFLYFTFSYWKTEKFWTTVCVWLNAWSAVLAPRSQTFACQPRPNFIFSPAAYTCVLE